MTTAWNFAGESVPLGSGSTVTLVQGSSFCICDRTGDIHPGGPQGLFVRDTRFCSKLVLTFDGQEAEPLASNADQPFSASFVSRTRPGHAGMPPLLVIRRYWVGRGMRCDISVRNDAPEARSVVVELQLGADMAGLFAVKEGRNGGGWISPATVESGRVILGDKNRGRQTSIRMTPEPVISPIGTAWWTAQIPARGEWSTCLEFAPILEDQEVVPRYRCGTPVTEAEPYTRMRAWQDLLPRVDSDIPGLAPAIERAAEDLGALRIFDPDHPDRPVIAAGAPWYMTLFGRDSILTSWMSLFFDPDLGLSVAETLARLQGTKVDAATEEQPGRILHEVRFASTTSLALGSGEIYYGTADATPLFVMLVGELLRWGTPLERLQPLLPAVEAALTWMTDYGDADGDGYVEYERLTLGGLANQGWKDSADGVSYADGRLPAGPVALCEIQAYCYAAWRAAADLAEAAGNHDVAAERRRRADDLRVAFNRDYWLPEANTFAVALDGDKSRIDSLTSNPGHCLWCGIVDTDKAAGVAAGLARPDMFSGWGIRTLSTQMARYNPVSYHNGSVWPHDTAICAAGLRRYGFHEEANRIALALLAAAAATDERLPELFSGLSLGDFPAPVAYPTSCSPQAWASAAPLLLARSMLGIEPDIPAGTFGFHPALPEGAKRLIVRGLPIAGFRINVICDDNVWSVSGLPEGIKVVDGQP